MPETENNPLSYYSFPGPITDPGDFSHLLDNLPDDIAGLCGIIQGLMLHLHWAERYGIKASDEKKSESNLRLFSKQLARISAIDGSPLTDPRPLEKRIMGTCRDYATILSAILRNKGVPARARCGFGTYFSPGFYEDHWVAEYWNAKENRWVMVDAQIDDFQRNELKIDFDLLDLPLGKFLVAGQAWNACRKNQANPDNFGIFDMRGLWFIASNLVRDLASLNKMEFLPWDIWGIIKGADSGLTDLDFELLDETADITSKDNSALSSIISFYNEHDSLKVPQKIMMYTDADDQIVDWTV